MLHHRITNGYDFFDILGYEREEDLSTIVELLSKYYSITITKKWEAPTAILWYLRIDGFEITLVNEFYGSYLKPDGELACEFFKAQQEKIKLILSKNI
jgi:hypothetical protein